ncbi:MAG: ribosome maturation factor RimM [Holosporaceae bacterium]|jgi:16S rRNA processing protein RimM|nr:ribosome maturation factor RimM [Holosporaceae bacterium]
MNDFIEILQVTGAFGIRGFLRASLFSQNIGRYRQIYDTNGNGYKFHVVRYVSGNSVVLALEGVADRTTAESMRGMFFYVRRADLPELAEQEYYVCDLVGKTISVGNSSEVCTIVAVHNFGASYIIELSHNGVTFFVPFTDENFPGNCDHITAKAFGEYTD